VLLQASRYHALTTRSGGEAVAGWAADGKLVVRTFTRGERSVSESEIRAGHE